MSLVSNVLRADFLDLVSDVKGGKNSVFRNYTDQLYDSFVAVIFGLCQVLVAALGTFVASFRIFPCGTWALGLWCAGIVALQHVGF